MIDETGLPEIYAIDLQYAPPDVLESTDAPSIFTALREAELILRPAEVAIEIFKVDRANAKPTAN